MRTMPETAPSSAPRYRFAGRLFRRLVHARLASIRRGRLRVRDPLGSADFGEPGAPMAEIRITDLSCYRELCLQGGLGAAAAYMDGKWHSPALGEVFTVLLDNLTEVDAVSGGAARIAAALASARHRWRRNSRAGSQRNIGQHYDLGNEFFALFLDDSMTYSAAIYPDPNSSLGAASRHKLDLICRKLRLGPGDHVLEIGSGWGSFAIHAARHYGCRVTTTTISAAQHAFATRRIAAEGLGDRVSVRRDDYRDLDGIYDKLVSIEMIEAVGHQRLPAFFAACSRLLKDDGAMLLQVISMPEQRYRRYLRHSDFIQRYIFPGSCCPSLGAMLDAVRRSSDLKLVHGVDIAAHYARTLRDWRDNFERHEGAVRALGYPQRFVRMWRYYLNYCEAGFASRYLSDYQLVFTRPGSRLEGIGDDT